VSIVYSCFFLEYISIPFFSDSSLTDGGLKKQIIETSRGIDASRDASLSPFLPDVTLFLKPFLLSTTADIVSSKAVARKVA